MDSFTIDPNAILSRVEISYIMSALAGAVAGYAFYSFRLVNRPASAAPRYSYWSDPLAGVIAGILLLWFVRHFGWTTTRWDYIAVACLGAAVGAGELASRYRDEPAKAILTIPAFVYIALNAGASILALALGRQAEWWQADENAVPWTQVLTAGLGAMVLLRSSVFRVRMGDKKDVDIGPSTFLTSIIDAADRAVDRHRAQERAWTVATVMQGVPHDKALAVLPSYIPLLMQNLSKEDRDAYDKSITSLNEGNLSEQMKASLLAIAVINHMGEGVLRAAVSSFAAQIRSVAKETQAATGAAAETSRATQDAIIQTSEITNEIAKATKLHDVAPEIKEVVEKATDTAENALTLARESADASHKADEAARELVDATKSSLNVVPRAGEVPISGQGVVKS